MIDDEPIGDIPDAQANLCDVLDVDDLENSLGGIRNMYTGFDVCFFISIEDNF